MFLCILLCILGTATSGFHYCYDQKCKNYDGSYITCNQEHYYCDEGDFWDNDAECSSSLMNGIQNSDRCWDDDEVCTHDSYTGEGICVDKEDHHSYSTPSPAPHTTTYDPTYTAIPGTETSDSISTVIGLILAGVMVIIIGGCCCFFCYCAKKCCCTRRQGHVINRPSQNVQLVNLPGQHPAAVPLAYPPTQSAYPPAQGAYPPAQGAYPPAQGAFPPAQGGYPPAQGAYPPATSSQYPPPPAQGPPEKVHSTSDPDPPPPYSSAPPMYEAQPAENPYFKS